MSSTSRATAQSKQTQPNDTAEDSSPDGHFLSRDLDLSPDAFNRALRCVATEELELVRARYLVHGDPVRCAIGISLVLRSLANELFGEERIRRLRRVSWLNFLLRTSSEQHFRPHVIETMSAALYGDPPGVELPGDCGFWFSAAQQWIEDQRGRRPLTSCANPLELDL